MSNIIKEIRKPILVALILLLLCGLAYPLILTGVSQLVFPKEANGSLIKVDGEAVGSELISQEFTDSRFMKNRPSAINYNTYSNKLLKDDPLSVKSGSENKATTSLSLQKRVKKDIESFLAANPSVKREEIPTDLLTSSASGLDPHISPESADIQIPAISKASGLSEKELREIIKNNTSKKLLGVFGEETVNVLKVNLDIALKLGLYK